MNAHQIADILESIAQLLELKGENAFKVRAYRNAARILPLEGLNEEDLRNPERLEQVEGIGKAIAEKIAALAESGRLKFYEELKAEFPSGLFELFEVQGLGAKKIKVLYESLNVVSIAALEKACKEGKVAKLPGFGAKTETNLLRAIEDRQKNAEYFRVDVASVTAAQMREHLHSHPDATLVEVAGSFRRRKEVVRDLDFIVVTKNPEAVSARFVSHPEVKTVLAHGTTKSSVLLHNGMQCDLRVVSMEEFPYALNYFTGSKEHNVVMRQRALAKGWSLNEYRFSLSGAKSSAAPLPKVSTEEDIYRALGLDYIPPELRENRGEFAAAEKGSLPRLITLENLRGTFHCHTTESDGEATLDEMAEAAMEWGWEYLGIADHSKSAFQARGLDEARLAAQQKEIAQRNQTYQGFRLFSGVECDILKDGRLDFEDEVLASLDYVVASVHNAFSLSASEMTKRLIRAISHPQVTMLGHLTGRLLLKREPYAVDVPAVLEAAAETGTIIELNASPERLDLDWRWWPLAIEKGVLCAINPDAHSVRGLQNLYFGVGIARKGWLTKKEVVNCLSVGEIEKILAKKRRQ